MIKYVNDVGVTNAFYEALIHDEYDHPDGWSPSSLSSPPHQRKLMAEIQASENTQTKLSVERRIHLFMGTAMHSYMEKSPYVFTEKRLFVSLQGEKISAKFDLYDPRDKSIQDFKVVGKNSAFNNGEVSVKDEYAAQLNINAYIFRKHDLPVNKLYVNYIFKDFMYRDKFSSNGPTSPVKSVEVRLWTDGEVEEYLIGRINYHKNWNQEHCTFDERWAKKGKFALMKVGRKNAVKLYEVNDPLPTLKEDQYWEHRPGEDPRCESYCDANSVCSYYLRKKEAESERS